ncbi:uncharacterized protein [Miscanthus floridulus]|uniref:uncharacterized protein n=1 Tax=Miscanthus floridulus TaxID=154761 RepID=UPI00345A19A2
MQASQTVLQMPWLQPLRAGLQEAATRRRRRQHFGRRPDTTALAGRRGAHGPSPPHSPGHSSATASGDAPSGAPATRPRESWCYIQWDAALDNAEASLRFSVVAQTRCGMTGIPIDTAREAIAAAADVQTDEIVLRHFYPENFIVICASQAVKDRVLAATPLPLGATSLVLRPWTRLAHADMSVLLYRVNLVLEGIPPHAWREDTAAKILAPSCWVQSVDEATATGSDLSMFKVTAWTAHPSTIPLICWLGIAENEAPHCFTAGGPPLPPYLREKKLLGYKVLIDIKSVADFSSRPPSPDGTPPSDDRDSGHDGNPDNTHFSRGAGPQLHGFQCSRGVIDGGYGGAPGCNGGSGGHVGGRSRGHTAPVPGPNGSRRPPIGAAAAGPQRHHSPATSAAPSKTKEAERKSQAEGSLETEDCSPGGWSAGPTANSKHTAGDHGAGASDVT